MQGVAPFSQDGFSRHAWRAPQDHRGVLLDPPLDRVEEWIERNAASRAGWKTKTVAGLSLTELCSLAKGEIAARALEYSSSYRAVQSRAPDRIILAGHQPELFHPGVWFKNFLLSRLAARHGALGINLVIDGDALKTSELLVPTGTIASPSRVVVPIDAQGPEIPFEDRMILDGDRWSTLPERVSAALGDLVPNPLVHDLWKRVLNRSASERRLGACLAQGRHMLEGDWGLQTLELPQSQFCATKAFQLMALQIFCHSPQFQTVYNDALRAFKQAHRIRSRNHPAPELASDGDWREMPLWIWTSESPTRRRLFVKHSGTEFILSDRADLEYRIPSPMSGSFERSREALLALERRGIRIRSRALLTTLAVRMLVGDLFIHGIGGGVYDQLTDRIMAQFFGVTPPRYLVATATLHLIPQTGNSAKDQLAQIDQAFRELIYHPEQALASHENSRPGGKPIKESDRLEAAQPWLATKERWIKTPQTRSNAKARCRAIREANSQLQNFVEAHRQRLQSKQGLLRAEVERQAMLGWREYSFCLYPIEVIRNFFLEMLGDKV